MVQHFSFPSNRHWELLRISNEWGNELDTFFAAQCLDAVKEVLATMFGADYRDSLRIAVLHHPIGPCCVTGSRTIFLHVNAPDWARFIYQFSHEACHICIEESCDPQIMWLEEVICEMSSQYVLHVLSKKFTTYPNPAYEDFGENMMRCLGCVNKDSSDCRQLDHARSKGLDSCLACESYPCHHCGVVSVDIQAKRSTCAKTVTWAILPYVGGIHHGRDKHVREAEE